MDKKQDQNLPQQNRNNPLEEQEMSEEKQTTPKKISQSTRFMNWLLSEQKPDQSDSRCSTGSTAAETPSPDAELQSEVEDSVVAATNVASADTPHLNNGSSFRTYGSSSGGWAFGFERDRPFTPHNFNPSVTVFDLSKIHLPKVLISLEAYDRMWAYADLCSLEIGWLGTAKRTESGDFLIEKIFLPRQEVSGTHTKITVAGHTELGMEILQDPERGVETFNNLRFWGHSHVHMSTSPSGQDLATSMEYVEMHRWFIRAIVNKYGRAEFTIYDKENNVVVRDAQWNLYDTTNNRIIRIAQKPKTNNQQLRQEIESEIKAKVTKPTFIWDRNHNSKEDASADDQSSAFSGFWNPLNPDTD